MATITRLRFTGDIAADRFISTDPLALLVGMLLDQQVPIERAFAAPYLLSQRLDVAFDAAEIAAMRPVDLEACFRQPPALHRYPGIMARRVHALCAWLVAHAHGDPTVVWLHADSGRQLLRTLKALPGFGEHTSRIFVALLAKQLGVRPTGWEQAAGEYALPGHRSVADVTDRRSLERVRAWKRDHRHLG